MTTQYFAYMHCKPDGTPFYIGKGPRERMLTTKRPQRFYTHVVNKYGRENIQIHGFACQSERHAMEVEDELIEFFRLCGDKLANITGGGFEGVSGYKFTDAQRANMSARMLLAHQRPEVKASFAARGKLTSERMKGDTRLVDTMRNSEILREKHRASLCAAFLRPEVKVRRKEIHESPEWRAKVSETTKRAWAKIKERIASENRTWVHNDFVCTVVPEKEAQFMVSQGWKFGRGKFHAGRWNCDAETKAKYSAAQSEVMRKAMVGARWINNGVELKKVRNPKPYLKDGWKLGLGGLRKYADKQ